MRLQVKTVHLLAAVVATAMTVASAQTPQPGRVPQRDTPAQGQDAAPTPAGSMSGRVVAADTGRPVKRARVFVTANELPGGRGTLTADDGTFEIVDLPAGRYTLTVSKSGFVSLSYGQRRPLQAGTPLQLAEGQQIRSIEFRLPRGSVIAGHVFDETGDPMAGIVVRVLRYQYQQGDRRLVAAGTSTTDDQGAFRVWGLNPGEYYVDAQQRAQGGGPLGGGFGRGPAAPAGARGGGGRGGPAAPGVIAAAPGTTAAASDDETQKAYAPTYFPGVTTIAEARPITVGLSETSLPVEFSLQLVHISRVSGTVLEPDGSVAWGGNVTLVADQATVGRGGGFGINYGSRISWDGTFAVNNVPPGRYTLEARGPNDDDVAKFATQPVVVSGSADVDDVSVLLQAGASITGTLVFPVGANDLPNLTQVRVSAPSIGPSAGNVAQGRVGTDGVFTITGVEPGEHLIRPNGQLRSWRLATVTVNGRDVTDVPVSLRSSEQFANVVITFTDKTTEVSGTLARTNGTPVTEYTVLAFSTDPAFWQPQSRHIATARPDQTGKYRIRGLPAGSYYMTTVDPAEQGEWFEPTYLDAHRIGAARIAIAEGDVKTQDFRIREQ